MAVTAGNQRLSLLLAKLLISLWGAHQLSVMAGLAESNGTKLIPSGCNSEYEIQAEPREQPLALPRDLCTTRNCRLNIISKEEGIMLRFRNLGLLAKNSNCTNRIVVAHISDRIVLCNEKDISSSYYFIPQGRAIVWIVAEQLASIGNPGASDNSLELTIQQTKVLDLCRAPVILTRPVMFLRTPTFPAHLSTSSDCLTHISTEPGLALTLRTVENHLSSGDGGSCAIEMTSLDGRYHNSTQGGAFTVGIGNASIRIRRLATGFLECAALLIADGLKATPQAENAEPRVTEAREELGILPSETKEVPIEGHGGTPQVFGLIIAVGSFGLLGVLFPTLIIAISVIRKKRCGACHRAIPSDPALSHEANSVSWHPTDSSRPPVCRPATETLLKRNHEVDFFASRAPTSLPNDGACNEYTRVATEYRYAHLGMPLDNHYYGTRVNSEYKAVAHYEQLQPRTDDHDYNTLHRNSKWLTE